MTTPIVLRYHNTQRDMADAMTAAGKTLAGTKRDWPFFLGSIVAVYLTVVGGIALGALVWTVALDRAGSIIPWLVLGAVLGLGVTLVTFRRMVWVQAGVTLHTRFGAAEQEMTVSPDGLILRNDVANWRTTWAGVEAVVPTKTGLAIVISGITLPVPNAAFEGGMSKESVTAEITAWQRDARA